MANSSWYRRSIWHFKGTREFTKSGYEIASNNFVEKDLDVDCSGKHYMITGANSGIGLATALEIAKRGGELHLVCRNAKSMKEARSHIITTTGNDRIYQHQVNLSKSREVKRWAEEFVKTNKRLDVLINNAGCMTHDRIVDDDGNENNFSVNTLAVHIIVTALIPLIERSSDGGRVITVSSAVMLTVKLDTDDLNSVDMKPFIGAIAYSQAKRQQVVMNFSYAQQFPKVHFSCMHPGWVDTPALKTSMPEFYEKTKDSLRTPLQGSDTIVWLAVSNAAAMQPSGIFFQDRVPTVTHLPMAWTKVSYEIEQKFMKTLDELVTKISNTVDYFTISNVGSDIIASDSFLGQNDKIVTEEVHNSIISHSSSVINQDPAEVISKQTSLDHPSRSSNSLPSSDDDAIINAVETILYNDSKTKLSTTNKVNNVPSLSRPQIEKRNQELYLSAEKISSLQIDLSNNSIKTERFIAGSTSDIRKEAAIDDLLNDAFQTVNLEDKV